MSRQTHINQTSHSAQSPVFGLSLADILSGFWSRKIPIAIFVALTLIATYLIISRIEPTYKSEAKVLIEGHDPDTNKFSTNQQATPADQLKVSSQAQIMLSHNLADKVIDKMNLARFAEFKESGGLFGSAPQTSANTIRDKYFEKLSVYPIAETRVIAIEFSSTSAERAANMANQLADAYIESTRQKPLAYNKQTNSFLSREIRKIENEILNKEKSLEKYRARNGLIEGNNGTLYAQELAELNRQIAEVSSIRAEASAKSASAKRLLGGNQSIDIASDVINSPHIQNLRQEQIKLRRKITEMSTTYLPAHPQMVQLNQQLQNLDRLVAFEVTKIAASLSDQAKVAAARENTLRAKLNRLKAKAVGQGQNAAKLKSMERDIEAKRTLLNTYYSKQADTISRQDISNIPYGARLISKAVASAKPAFPKVGPIMFLALISSLILAFVVSFLKDAAIGGRSNAPALTPQARQLPQNAHISPSQQIQPQHMQTQHMQSSPQSPPPAMPVAAPTAGGTSRFNLALSEKTDLSTLYAGGNALETGLMEIANHAADFLASTGSKTIMVTSQDAYPQKGFISAGLARLFGKNGIKTIIVDADMMNPTISHLMSVQPSPGLSEILTGAAPFSETVVKDRNTGASVIPAGSRGTQAYGQLGTDATSLVLRSLSMVYDVIIIHAPGVNEHAATLNLAPQAGYVCLAGGNGWGEKQKSGQLASSLISQGAGHVAQINCSAKSGGLGLFKSKAA